MQYRLFKVQVKLSPIAFKTDFRIMEISLQDKGRVNMKINLYREDKLPENYMDIHFQEMNASIQGIIDFCKASQIIIGRNDKLQKKIYPTDIYYCEIVDRKCYAYLKEEVYQIDFSIQKLQELFTVNGLVRISKAMLVNIYKIDRLKTDLNMRVHISLDNGEKVVLNRAYKKEFLSYLQERKKEYGYETDK
jgi:DNA-binding LytR/AlgR family response regulator